jgi:hypothetical protein
LGSAKLIELLLKVVIFKEADVYYYVSPPDVTNLPDDKLKKYEEREKEVQTKETQRQRQREAANAISLIAVGLPVYMYHWKIIQKEHAKNQ